MKSARYISSFSALALAAALLSVVVIDGSAGAWVPRRTPAELGQTGPVAERDTGTAFYRPSFQIVPAFLTADPNVDNNQLQDPRRPSSGVVGWEYSTVTSSGAVGGATRLTMRSWGQNFTGLWSDETRPGPYRALASTALSTGPGDSAVEAILDPATLSFRWVDDSRLYSPSQPYQWFGIGATGSNHCAYWKETKQAYLPSRTPFLSNQFTDWRLLPWPPVQRDGTCRPNQNVHVFLMPRGQLVAYSTYQTQSGQVIDMHSWLLEQGQLTRHGSVSIDIPSVPGGSVGQPASGVAFDPESGLVVVSPPGGAPLVGRYTAGSSSVSLVPSGGTFPGSGFPDGLALGSDGRVRDDDFQLIKDSTGAYLVERGASGRTWAASVSLPSASVAVSASSKLSSMSGSSTSAAADVGSSTIGDWYGIGGWAQSGSLRTFTDGTSRATELSVIGVDDKTVWFKPLRDSAIGQQVTWKPTVVAEDDYPVRAQFALNPGEWVLQWTQSLVGGTPGGLQAMAGASSIVVVQTNQRLLLSRVDSAGAPLGWVSDWLGPITSDLTGITVVSLRGHDLVVVLDSSAGTVNKLQIGDGVLGGCSVGREGCSDSDSWQVWGSAAPGASRAAGVPAVNRALFAAHGMLLQSVPVAVWDEPSSAYLWSSTVRDAAGGSVSVYQRLSNDGLQASGWYANSPETATTLGGFIAPGMSLRTLSAQALADGAPSQPSPGAPPRVHSVWVRQESVSTAGGDSRPWVEVHQLETVDGLTVPRVVTAWTSPFASTPTVSIAGDGTVILVGADAPTSDLARGDAHLMRIMVVSSTGHVVVNTVASTSFIVAGNGYGHGDSIGAVLVSSSHTVVSAPTASGNGTGTARYVLTVASRGSDDARLYAVGLTINVGTVLAASDAVASGGEAIVAQTFTGAQVSTDAGQPATDFRGAISGAPALVSAAGSGSVTIFALGYADDESGQAWRITATVNADGLPAPAAWVPVGTGVPTIGGHAYRNDTRTVTPADQDTPNGLTSSFYGAPTATIDPRTASILTTWRDRYGTPWISTLNSNATIVLAWDEAKTPTATTYSPSLLTPNTSSSTGNPGAFIYTPQDTSDANLSGLVFGTTYTAYDQPVALY